MQQLQSHHSTVDDKDEISHGHATKHDVGTDGEQGMVVLLKDGAVALFGTHSGRLAVEVVISRPVTRMLDGRHERRIEHDDNCDQDKYDG